MQYVVDQDRGNYQIFAIGCSYGIKEITRFLQYDAVHDKENTKFLQYEVVQDRGNYQIFAIGCSNRIKELTRFLQYDVVTELRKLPDF